MGVNPCANQVPRPLADLIRGFQLFLDPGQEPRNSGFQLLLNNRRNAVGSIDDGTYPEIKLFPSERFFNKMHQLRPRNAEGLLLRNLLILFIYACKCLLPLCLLMSLLFSFGHNAH